MRSAEGSLSILNWISARASVYALRPNCSWLISTSDEGRFAHIDLPRAHIGQPENDAPLPLDLPQRVNAATRSTSNSVSIRSRQGVDVIRPQSLKLGIGGANSDVGAEVISVGAAIASPKL